MDLTLRQLAAFEAVARCGGYTAAARELRVSQSSLSRTVQEVERLMRVRLFERTTRSLRRTAEGDALLAAAERVLGTHRAEMNRLDRVLRGDEGTVTVATLPSVAAVLLPPVIADFRERHPGIAVRVLDGMARTALDRVASGTADLAVTAPDPRPVGLSVRPLVRDSFFAALPPGHALAAQERVTWARLGQETFIALGADSSVRRLTDRAFEEAGGAPATAIEAGNVSTVGGLVAAGLGVTALPSLVRVLMGFTDIAHRPVEEPVWSREIGVVTPRGRTPSPAAARFLERLESAPDVTGLLPEGAERV